MKKIFLPLLILSSLALEANQDHNGSSSINSFLPVKEKVVTTEYVKSFLVNRFKDKASLTKISLDNSRVTKYKNWNKNLYSFTVLSSENKSFSRTITLFCNEELKVCASDFIGEGGSSFLADMDSENFQKNINGVATDILVEGNFSDSLYIFGNKDCKYTKEFTERLTEYSKLNKTGLLYIEIKDDDFKKDTHFVKGLNIETIPAFFYKGKNITLLINKKFPTKQN